MSKELYKTLEEAKQNWSEIPIGLALDLTGQVFGRLTALYRTEGPRKGEGYWVCECSCGNFCRVLRHNLRNGKTTSCGCYQSESVSKNRKKDETGHQFGRLTILNHTGHKCICQCECGNIVETYIDDLRRGTTKSCGCLAKELVSQRSLIDLTGQRFGMLTVIERAENYISSNGHIITKWHCKCDCGNEKDIFTTYLKRGSTISCGCSKISAGELKIKTLLEENNIPFEFQKKFDNCRQPESNYLLSFDFYINNQYLIEYDGEQHFFSKPLFGGGGRLERQQFNDNFKNQWCKENNIPLIRIPYTHLQNIQLEDLLLKTSKFII